MFPVSSQSNHGNDDFTESQELLNLVMSWDRSKRLSDSLAEPEVIQIKFSDDLTNYIKTGVDPSGRYAQPPTRKENIGVVLGYAFFGLMMLVGLLDGGVGHKLFEELVRLIRGG
ncbi:MAG: hypothetical protein GC179_18465 [Anaerolineaceae bacterium]|nr:hypothetical protein [Anaerolineaceae bacterium]